MIGIPYKARIPAFSRSLVADEVLCRISAPSSGILLISRAFFGQRSVNSLNEVNAIAFARLSTDGTGGAGVTFEETIEAAAAFGGSGAAVDADGWTAQPSVSSQFNDMPFNFANGFEWTAQSEDDYILVPPTARLGLRILGAVSASMTFVGGIDFKYLGA